MKLVLALTLTNLAILGGFAVTKAQARPETQDVLRARLIELVDAKGEVRAQLKTETSGEVVLRLKDEKGQIRVKIGAGKDGSGLVLLDERTEPGVHMLAGLSALDGTHSTKITLADAQASRTLKPRD